MFIQTDFSL